MRAPRAAGALSLLLPGCLAMDELDPNQPCLEAGFAIAYKTESCTGDRELANARYDRFVAETTCVAHAPADDVAAGLTPEDLYDCAFAIERLSCEVAEDFGDDIEAWLSISPGCALVVEPKEGA